MLCRSVDEKRKLRTGSPSVLNFLWGSVSHFSAVVRGKKYLFQILKSNYFGNSILKWKIVEID